MLTKIVSSIPVLMIEEREKLKSRGNRSTCNCLKARDYKTEMVKQATWWSLSETLVEVLDQTTAVFYPGIYAVVKTIEFHCLTYFGVCCWTQFHLDKKNKNFATYYGERWAISSWAIYKHKELMLMLITLSLNLHNKREGASACVCEHSSTSSNKNVLKDFLTSQSVVNKPVNCCSAPVSSPIIVIWVCCKRF